MDCGRRGAPAASKNAGSTFDRRFSAPGTAAVVAGALRTEGAVPSSGNGSGDRFTTFTVGRFANCGAGCGFDAGSRTGGDGSVRGVAGLRTAGRVPREDGSGIAKSSDAVSAACAVRGATSRGRCGKGSSPTTKPTGSAAATSGNHQWRDARRPLQVARPYCKRNLSPPPIDAAVPADGSDGRRRSVRGPFSRIDLRSSNLQRKRVKIDRTGRIDLEYPCAADFLFRVRLPKLRT